MKILIDVDALEREGVLTPELAQTLRSSANRDTGSAAINMILAFGAAAVAAGLLVLFPSSGAATLFGLVFLAAGYLVATLHAKDWGQLGRIWMVVGVLTLAGSVPYGMDKPLLGSLAATAILTCGALITPSRFLMALAPLALAAAIGGSTGYWHACYEIAIREPTLTIVLFTAIGVSAWVVARSGPPRFSDLAITLARMCVVLVNFGFWIGSLWGDTPGHMLTNPQSEWFVDPKIPAVAFAILWAVGLAAAAYWGARNGRRFLVNAVATFGGIHFYTQWFERLGVDPLTVIGAGLLAIAIGVGFWRLNRQKA